MLTAIVMRGEQVLNVLEKYITSDLNQILCSEAEDVGDPCPPRVQEAIIKIFQVKSDLN